MLDKDNFLSEAVKISNKIAEKPKSSLIQIKKLISSNLNDDKNLANERNSFYRLLDSENAKIGINAFLNKTKPNWED